MIDIPKILISVIIPVYNEEKTIIDVLERVCAQVVDGFEFEVLVVDDGSNDGTAELLKEHRDLYTHLTQLPSNSGKGAAVMAALKEASGDYVLFQDADLEYDPIEYPKLLRPVSQFQADIVIGSRFAAPQCTRVYYFWHKVGNRLITFLFNLLNNTTFSDIYSGYFIYRRSLVDPALLVSKGWEQQAEILSRAVARGSQFYEVPISYFGRGYDEGKKIRGHHAVAVIWTIYLAPFHTLEHIRFTCVHLKCSIYLF